MALTQADIDQMITAINNLEASLNSLNLAASTTEDAMTKVKQQAWQSTDAAPAFYAKVAAWQSDHDEVTALMKVLIPLLESAKQDLQKAESALTQH